MLTPNDSGDMLPEVYFLRYSFPCARVLVDFRKTLSESEYDKMKQAVETDAPMPRDHLEKIFFHAVDGLKKTAGEGNKYWTVLNMREYFWNRHEEHLSTDLPPIVCRLCVVKPAKLVKEIKGYFKAELEGGEERIVEALYKGAAVGDTAMIHYGYAVEKVEDR